MQHCWHQDREQFTTWTPGEVRAYTCCYCGDHVLIHGTVTPDNSHGPFVSMPPMVVYEPTKEACPNRPGTVKEAIKNCPCYTPLTGSVWLVLEGPCPHNPQMALGRLYRDEGVANRMRDPGETVVELKIAGALPRED